MNVSITAIEIHHAVFYTEKAHIFSCIILVEGIKINILKKNQYI